MSDYTWWSDGHSYLLRVSDPGNAPHTRVSVFVGEDEAHRGLAGSLTFRNEELHGFVSALRDGDLVRRRLDALEQRADEQSRWTCPSCGGPLTADGRYPDPYCRSCERLGL